MNPPTLQEIPPWPQDASPDSAAAIGGSRILVVDDDGTTRLLLTEYLAQLGRRVTAFADGESALIYCRSESPDIILLDLMLPGRDGLSLIEEFRHLNPRVGIIMISARGEPIDRVVGLERGADDYLSKPFELLELAARVKALERRNSAINGPPPEPRCRFANHHLDFAARLVVRDDGTPVDLSDGEFRILRELARGVGEVVARDRLLEVLRRDGTPSSPRSLDVIVSRVRTKLGDAKERKVIATIHGIGYRLAPP